MAIVIMGYNIRSGLPNQNQLNLNPFQQIGVGQGFWTVENVCHDGSTCRTGRICNTGR
jgi:hypothetical protein